jgi:hypothetical protein
MVRWYLQKEQARYADVGFAQAKSLASGSFSAGESVFLAAHRDDAPSVAAGMCAWRLQKLFFQVTVFQTQELRHVDASYCNLVDYRPRGSRVV